MKNLILSVLFFVLFAVRAFAAATDTGTVIHIDVDTPDKMSVEGKSATGTTVSAMVASLVHDKDHTAVELKVPSTLDRGAIEQIKNSCRRAGISLFSVVTKPTKP